MFKSVANQLNPQGGAYHQFHHMYFDFLLGGAKGVKQKVVQVCMSYIKFCTCANMYVQSVHQVNAAQGEKGLRTTMQG